MSNLSFGSLMFVTILVAIWFGGLVWMVVSKRSGKKLGRWSWREQLVLLVGLIAVILSRIF